LDEVDITSLPPFMLSDDPVALSAACNILIHLDSSTRLKIDDEEFLMPFGALVFYHLHIIQLDETPDIIQNIPHYAANAFGNREGCTSTPDQRLRAYRYARADQLLNNLEIALKSANNKQTRSLLSDLNALAKKMPRSIGVPLQTFSSDDQQEGAVNLESLERTKQAMKQALHLP